jgi:hypothetical protein
MPTPNRRERWTYPRGREISEVSETGVKLTLLNLQIYKKTTTFSPKSDIFFIFIIFHTFVRYESLS